jgi:transcriptional repressor NrdR
MRCPTCKEIGQDRVIDSRLTNGGAAIRRRRECMACGRRYTTKERIEESDRLTVIKKDGTRMPFDAQKILAGMRHACYKRPVSQEQLQRAAEEIEEQISREFDREVPSRAIGGRVSRKLRELDKVAYVRFTSVYRDFKDLDDIIEEIELVKDSSDDLPGQQQLFQK